MIFTSRFSSFITLSLAAVLLSGCGIVDRLGHIGEQPQLTPIENPQGQPGYQQISMPMPSPVIAERLPNSLWRSGSRAFFRDLRATKVGDILTVVINMNERGQLSNSTTRSRTTSENDNINNLFGLQSHFNKVLPDALQKSLPSVLDLTGATTQSGAGQIQRQEQVNIRLAAIVTQLLPNGNLVLHGRQEMRVNFEVRDLQLAGIIRPEDIGQDNTITYDKVAEARISYSGRGQVTDVQQPRYGSQFLDIIYPF